MKKGIFISATSTAIGKTVISTLICKILLAQGKKVAYYKPVQTGAPMDNKGRLKSTDSAFVSKVIGSDKNFFAHCSYLFPEFASPHFAALLERKEIDMKKIRDDYRNLARKFDYVITEGAGGLHVPLNEKGFLMADMAKMLKLNTILVARAGLGALNQVGLSAFFMRKNRLQISALLLLTEKAEPSGIEEDNIRMIQKLTRVPNVYSWPMIPEIDTEKCRIGNIQQSIQEFPGFSEIAKWF
jgi:dethiobiotin synthetase